MSSRRPPGAWAGRGLAALVAACLVPACTSGVHTAGAPAAAPLAPGTPAGVRAGPPGDAFYQPPSPLPPGKPGTVIWATPIGGPGDSVGFKGGGHGVERPVGPGDDGGRQGVGRAAAGTVLGRVAGLDGRCAPSKSNGAGEAAEVAARLVPRGFVVTATDYEGLGTPGVHPWVVGQSEGRAVLDSIRAARQLTADPAGQAVVWGHSQGGGAALFAAELAPTYGAGAGVVGAVAGAPAVELKLLAVGLRTSPFFGYVIMAAAGFHAAYPELDLSQVLTAKGLRLRGANPDDYLKADPGTVEPFATFLEENTPGNIATTVPIFVYHGDQDEQIPVVASLLLLQRVCRVGGFTVLRRTYAGASHVGVIAAATADIDRWISDRLAGTPPPTTACPR
ncbi:MAG: alpha/beta fold hydrolase [Actinobacteria bacterium]|nr:MAG: alpha/beta fold hydrolase [Actinomycetota bacterium]